MEPRLIIKTHSEVSKPGLFSILISKCSYADKSSYPEVVSKRLYELYEENGQPFNKLAAKFVVIMAQRFGFLRENMIWGWRGHVINGVLQYLNKTENENINLFLELTKLEKIIYLKCRRRESQCFAMPTGIRFDCSILNRVKQFTRLKCRRRESNSHGFPRTILSRVRLPIPPSRLKLIDIIYQISISVK